jgi:tryptophan 2,3-dioxygenase
MNPWDYHAIRLTLGRGSGLDSPGYRQITSQAAPLWQAFAALLDRHDLDLETLYMQAGTHATLLRIAEELISYDEGLQRFRYEHLRLTQRIIGPGVMRTGGVAVRELERGLNRCFFPALWANHAYQSPLSVMVACQT